MKNKLILFLLCIMPFLVLGCRESPVEPQTLSLTNVYTAAPLSAPEMQADVSSCQPFVYGDSLYLFDRIQNLYLYRFSLDGTYRETIAVPSLHKESLSLRQALLLDNGDFLGLAKSITDDTYFLLQFRSDGSIVHRAAIEEGDSSLLLAFANDEYYLINGTTVLVFSDTLAQTRQLLLDFLPTEMRTLRKEDTDTLYLLDSMGSLYILDGQNGSINPIYVPEVWDNAALACPGYGYDYYIADSEGIFGITGDERTLLCSFGNSNLSYKSIKKLTILSPQAFFIQYQTQERAEYLLLTPSDTAVERIPLRMAYLAPGTAETMRAILSSFHLYNTEYFIELTDYNRYNLFGVDPQGVQQFQKDLLSGEKYDLYVLSFGDLYGNFMDNGSLAELSSICDDNLLPCVKTAYETEYGIYGLPFSIEYSLLAMPETRDSTLAGLAEASAESAADRDVLVCNTDCTDRMADVYAASLIHGNAGRFCTPDFYAFLETIRTFRQNCGGRYGTVETNQYDTYKELVFGGDTMQKAVKEDRLKYLYMNMNDPAMLGVYKLIYGDTPAHLSGYPTADGGNAAWGYVFANLCVPIDGNITGAKAFLRFYLSDRVQTNPLLIKDHLPITETGLQKATEARYYYYRVDNFNAIRLHSKYPDKPLNPPTSTVTDLVEAVLTDEELEAFRDLIRGAVLSTGQDDMVTQILSEELDPYFAGDRTAEATAEIIEKRAGIYLAE